MLPAVCGCRWPAAQQPPGSYYDRELLDRMLTDPFSMQTGGASAPAAEAKMVADECCGGFVSGRRSRKTAIRAYLRKHPELSSQRPLLGSVLAWAGRGWFRRIPTRCSIGHGRHRKNAAWPGYSGHWYGVVSQDVALDPPYGKMAYNLFAQVQVEADGNNLRGGGKLGNGNEIAFSGVIDGAAFTGTLTNLTIGLQSELSGQFFEEGSW